MLTNGRRTKSDDNSSHGLKPGELKKGTHRHYMAPRFFLSKGAWRHEKGAWRSAILFFFR
jgi:hypothetical protein